VSELLHFIDDAGNSTCVTFLKGTADVANHDHFEKAMSDALAHAAKFVVLDIRELGFITSLGVGEILRLHKAKKQAGGHVVIVGPNQYVEGVFKAARLTSVMTIVPTVDEGLAACGKA
jgi:anti-anti-sigma factor